MAESDKVFAGSLPKFYDTLMVAPVASQSHLPDWSLVLNLSNVSRRPGA